MPEVIVYAVEGRTPEQKKALMKDITDAGGEELRHPHRRGHRADRRVAAGQQGQGRRTVQRAVTAILICTGIYRTYGCG